VLSGAAKGEASEALRTRNARRDSARSSKQFYCTALLLRGNREVLRRNKILVCLRALRFTSASVRAIATRCRAVLPSQVVNVYCRPTIEYENGCVEESLP
jgi:hypothetical protein